MCGVVGAAELVEEGSTIVGSQVTVRTSRGRRVVDHIVQDADGNLVAVDVKSGNATRSAAQKAKDAVIETEGGVATGKNAGEMAGQTIQVKTVERRVP